MTAITLNDIQSGYNVHKVNDNFTILEDNINNDVLHTAGGGNTMNQDIDMDGNSIFNLTTDSNNSQSAVSVQYLREFTGVAEGIDERVDRLEVLSTDRIVIDLLGALTYNLTVTEALHTSISFLNPHSSGSTLVTIPNVQGMPVRFYVHNDGPYDLEFVGVTGTPLVIKPGTTPLFKYLPTGEVYTSYVFSQPYAGSVVQDSLDSALYDSVTEVQAGIPTNNSVVVNDTLTDAIWKLQGQANAKLEYKYFGPWAGKPSAATLGYGDAIFVTDIPALFGSAWYANPGLDAYYPQTGNWLVSAIYSPSDSDASGIDQILQSANIHAAYLFNVVPLDFDILISKSGTTDSATIKLRMGTAGDLTDPVIATFSMSAAQRKLRLTPSAQLTSSTTINCQPELATDNASNNAWLADVTIPDVSNALTLSLSVELSGTTDTVTCHSFYTIQRGLG